MSKPDRVKPELWGYQCVVMRWLDGDTVDVSVDLGFKIWMVQRVRLHGLNCPEMNTDAGKAAKAFVERLAPIGTNLLVRSQKADVRDKYGRWLIWPWLPDGRELVPEIIRADHGKLYMVDADFSI